MIRIRSVKPLARFQVQLELTNGRTIKVDLEPYLRGPVFDPIRKSRGLFETVKVDDALGTIVWENGADIDPDVLIENLVPAWLEKENRMAAVRLAAAHEPSVSYGRKRKKKKP